MYTPVFYFDFYVGNKEQSADAWQFYPVKLTGVTYEGVMNQFCDMYKIDNKHVMRVDKYILKTRKGKTQYTFKWVDFRDWVLLK